MVWTNGWLVDWEEYIYDVWKHDTKPGETEDYGELKFRWKKKDKGSNKTITKMHSW